MKLPTELMMGVGKSSLVKSVQHIEAEIPVNESYIDVTIDPVNVNKTSLVFNGHDGYGGTNIANIVMTCAELIDSTTIRFRRNSSYNANMPARACVIQWQPWAVKKVIHGTLSAGSSTPVDVSDVNRCAVFHLGVRYNSSSTVLANITASLSLTSLGDLVCSRSGSSGTLTVSYCVVEFNAGVLVSRQIGSVTASTTSTGDETITAVDPACTMIAFGGSRANTSSSDYWSRLGHIRLLNATTVRIQKNNSVATCTATFTVLEFHPKFLNQPVQRGVQNISGSSTVANATINAVEPSKTINNFLGFSGGSDNVGPSIVRSFMTSATNIQFSRRANTGSVTSSASWEAIEFK